MEIQGSVRGNFANIPTNGAAGRNLAVPQAMEVLDHRVDELEKSLGALTERLSTVLRAEPPRVNHDKLEPEAPPCPLATAIEVMANRVRKAMNVAESIIERLEI